MNKDYAIIFQKFEHEEVEYYLPIDVTEGIYLEKNNTFTAYNIISRKRRREYFNGRRYSKLLYKIFS